MNDPDAELGGPGTARPEPPSADPDHEDPDDADRRASEDFDALLSSLPEEGMQVQIMIYDKRGKRKWLDTWGAEGFSLEDLRREFGGGKFQLRLLNHRGRYMKGKTVEVAGRPKNLDELDLHEDEEPARREDRRGEPSGEGAALAEVAAHMAKLAERFERMYEDLRRPDPAFQQQNPAELFSSMLTAVQAATEPLRETIRAMQESERRDDHSATAALLQGVELGTQLARGGDGYTSVVERLGVPLLETLQRMSGQGAGAGSPALPNPPTTEAPSDMIDKSKLPEDRPPRWPAFLGPYLPTLVQMAERGLDPELRAAVVLDEIPGGLYPAIGAELAREGFREEFYNAVEAAGPHQAWLNQFFDAAVHQLTGEEAGAE